MLGIPKSISSSPESKKPLVPTNPPESAPNIRANPARKKAIVPIETVATFLAKTLTTFFVRANPLSTMAKPECIKNTMNAAIKTHNVDTDT